MPLHFSYFLENIFSISKNTQKRTVNVRNVNFGIVTLY